MTAIIGIMNKRAIAIAADSAVYVNSAEGHKIYNTANKIFTLSKHHPIAVMIYNSSDLMTIPWETIIKMYRDKIDSNSYPKLSDYKDDFINYVKENYVTNNLLISNEKQKNMQLQNLQSFSPRILTQMAGHSLEDFTEEELTKFLNELDPGILESYVNDQKEQIINDNLIIHELDDYSFEHFTNYLYSDFKAFLSQFMSGNPNIDRISSLLLELYFLCYIKIGNIENLWTGLVFIGFGNDEIYPRMYELLIGEVFDYKLRYYEGRSVIIDDQFNGAIMPFAQRDVIDNIITGINSEITSAYANTMFSVLKSYNQKLIDVFSEDPEITKEISSLNISEWVDVFNKTMGEYIGNKFILPIVNAVSTLSKEDLAEMAESLIKLTYLQRRMSFHEESVGGPIDVAIISKGDGFVWIKRKQYFDPKINQHFIKNYL